MAKKGYKNCPFCYEEIRDQAIKCRFCQSLLLEDPKNPQAACIEADKASIAKLIDDIAKEKSDINDLLEQLMEKVSELSQSEQYLEKLVDVGYKCILYERTFRELLKRCYHNNSDLVVKVVENHIENTNDESYRALLLLFMFRILGKDALEDKHLEHMLRTLEHSENLDRLKKRLLEIGNRSLKHVLEKFTDITNDISPEHVRFIDDCCRWGTGIDNELKEQSYSLFTEIIKGQDKRLKLAVLESHLTINKQISGLLRSRMSANLLDGADDLSQVHQRKAVITTLSKLGVESYEQMKIAVNKNPDDKLVYSAIGEFLVIEQKLTEDIVGSCNEIMLTLLNKIEETAFENKEYLLAAGRIGRNRNICIDIISNFIFDLIRHSKKSKHSMEIILSLAEIAHNPLLPDNDIKRLIALFSGMLNSKLSDESVTEQHTEEGIIYNFGPETEYEAEIIPAALDALGALYYNETIEEYSSSKIIDLLVDKWQAIKNYEEIWSPLNRTMLAKILASIAANKSSDSEVRKRIMTVLNNDYFVHGINEMPVVEFFPEIFKVDNPGETFGYLLTDAIKVIMESLLDSTREIWEKSIFAKSLAGLTSLNNFYGDIAKDNEIREKFVSILCDMPVVDYKFLPQYLKPLKTSKNIDEKLKSKIDKYLLTCEKS